MQVSCLQLGFYVASWGMLRGSTVLLQKSVRYFAPVIDVIAASPKALWQSDANDYSDEVSDLILDTARDIRAAFPDGASDTLVTKIMLGVFGCVPAFDTYFRKGSGISTFGRTALQRVAGFYGDNAEVIERHRELTLDFDTGTTTDRRYSRAKVIDMVFFVEGAS